MRPKLLKFFQHRRKLSNIREKYLCAKYDQMMEAWQQNTEKTENNVKRKCVRCNCALQLLNNLLSDRIRSLV